MGPKKEDYLTLIKANAAKLPADKILSEEISVLLGISDSTVKILKQLDIHTVFDLASSRIFNNALTITNAADDPDTLESKLAATPTGMVDKSISNKSYDEIKDLSTRYLHGIGHKKHDEVVKVVKSDTIRDFAYWPPFAAAKKILEAVLNPDENLLEDPDAPSELLPVARKYAIEKRYYRRIFLDRMEHEENLSEIKQALDLLGDGSDDLFTTPATGALLEFEQTWMPQGLSLGGLTYSLALAPGESTRIAVIDWFRREAAQVAETVTQQETLEHVIGQKSAMQEIADGVVTEEQQGSSKTDINADTTSGGGGGGASFLGISIGGSYSTSDMHSDATSVSSSSGRRNASAETIQDLQRSTQQSAASTRARRAAVIKEVIQAEREEIKTRIITNYNHSHALSVHYYEVVQVYKTALKLAQCRRVLFIPIKPLDFNDPLTFKRFKHLLLRGTRSTYERELIAHATGDIRIENIRKQGEVVMPDYFLIDPDAILEGMTFDRQLWPSASNRKSSLHISRITIYLKNEDEHGNDHYDATLYTSAERYVKFNFNWILRVRDIHKIRIYYKSDKGKLFGSKLRMRIGGRAAEYATGHSVFRASSSRYADLLRVAPSPQSGEASALLKEQASYYNTLVLMSLDRNTLAGLLSRYRFRGRPILEHVETRPLAVYGNYIVLKYFADEDEHDTNWENWRKKHAVDEEVQEDLVSVPTGGVFAEAVLGRYNASEKIDLTRFWDWQTSPIPENAPQIAPVVAASRKSSEDIRPGSLDTPVVNIQNPQPWPQSKGMSEMMNVLSASNLFRDMSGLSDTIAAARQGLQDSGRSAEGQGQLASQNMKIAADLQRAKIEAIAQLAGIAMGVPSADLSPATSNASYIGGLMNWAEQYDKQQRQSNGNTDGNTAGTTPPAAEGNGSPVNAAGGEQNTGLGRKLFEAVTDPRGSLIGQVGHVGGGLSDTQGENTTAEEDQTGGPLPVIERLFMYDPTAIKAALAPDWVSDRFGKAKIVQLDGWKRFYATLKKYSHIGELILFTHGGPGQGSGAELKIGWTSDRSLPDIVNDSRFPAITADKIYLEGCKIVQGGQTLPTFRSAFQAGAVYCWNMFHYVVASLLELKEGMTEQEIAAGFTDWDGYRFPKQDAAETAKHAAMLYNDVVSQLGTDATEDTPINLEWFHMEFDTSMVPDPANLTDFRKRGKATKKTYRDSQCGDLPNIGETMLKHVKVVP